jgi:hypothetical protein
MNKYHSAYAPIPGNGKKYQVRFGNGSGLVLRDDVAMTWDATATELNNLHRLNETVIDLFWEALDQIKDSDHLKGRFSQAIQLYPPAQNRADTDWANSLINGAIRREQNRANC